MSLRQGQGTIAFWINHPVPDWPTNTTGYSLGGSPTSDDGVFVAAFKRRDRSLEVVAMDATTTATTFKEEIPALDHMGLHIAVTWNDGTINLYLQGQPVRTVSLKKSP